MTLLISACLLGTPCRYDGQSKPLDPGVLDALGEAYTLIPVCPECLGGLPTPRHPSERVGERVVMNTGEDVTDAYRRGAEAALSQAREHGCTLALLKERSPSCGSGQIYDGSFTGTLTRGDGVTAGLLKARGVEVYGESRVQELLENADKRPLL